jgi:hypothetical protein
MYIQLTLEYVFMHLKIIWQMYLKSLIHKNTIVPLHVCIVSVALFTKILTIKNCRKCKTKIKHSWRYTPFLWCRRFYDTAVFILSVPMHCSATRGFFYLYIHKHNSHIYRNVWSFCPNVLNFCKYTYFYLTKVYSDQFNVLYLKHVSIDNTGQTCPKRT